MAAPLPSAPSRSSRHWILYGILVVLLFIMALIAKAAIVILAYRLLYPLPLLGGMARSLEVVEFLNILVFAIVGMGLGLLTRMLSPQTSDRVGYGLLIVLLPLLFFSGTIFHYQLWVNGVSSANELTYGAAHAMTDRWLEQTIHGSGVWGYYRFTAQYTTLPLEPDQVQVASLGMERVGKMLGEITGQSGPEMIGVLALNTWFLRLFYLGIACFSGLTHFQDGRAHAYQAKLRKNRQGSPNSSVPGSDGSGNPQPARSQAELDRARREKDRQDWQRQSQRDRVRDQQRLQPPQRRPNPRPAQQPHSDPKNS
ncbi:MAG: hypothetical protein ACO331_15675 [Prochlorothrix sp.]